MESTSPVDLIRSLWGTSLYRFSRESLAPVSLPESSKAFLVDVGLPTVTALSPGLGFKFSPEDVLAPFAELLDLSESEYSHQNDWKRSRRYRSFGMSYEAYLCADEKDGAVYRVETANVDSGLRVEDRFLNSSIEQFTSFIAWLEKCSQLCKAQAMTYPDSLKKLQAEFTTIDRKAMADIEWWPAFLEEMS
jgi:hypothetical protein